MSALPPLSSQASISSFKPPFSRKIKFSPLEIQCPFPHLRKPDPLWTAFGSALSTIWILTSRWKINKSPFAYQIYAVSGTAARPGSYDLPDLSHRSTWRQQRVALSSSRIDTLRSRPGPDCLYPWSIARHPPLGCKATLSLQSKNIAATTGCPQLSGRVACRLLISHNSFV